MTQYIDNYQSITLENRDLEDNIINKSLEHEIKPLSIRYGIFNDVCRGIIKDSNENNYYFNFPPTGKFILVKADTPTKQWEANKLLKNCQLGCDLVKALEEEDDEHEDEQKAEVAELPPAARSEEQNIAAQDSQITEHHPGATTASTPQSDESKERWHGPEPIVRSVPEEEPIVSNTQWNTNSLMKAWGDHLQSTAPKFNSIDPKQRQFMIEVLGKTPNEVDSGNTKLNPIHRVQFNQWLNKSLHSRLNTLQDWLKKSR
jgi:hypothetical protein